MIIVPSNVSALAAPTYAGINDSTLTAGVSRVITGTNFAAGITTVTFNGVSGSVSVSSSTALSVTVPNLSTAQSVTIVVSTPGGVATAANAATFFGVPSISGVSPTSGAAGTSLTVSGSNFTGIGSPSATIGGVAATITGVQSAGQFTVTVPTIASSGVKAITYTNPGGTASANIYTHYLTPTIGSGGTSVSPVNGTTGTTLTITGTNFVSGQTTVSIGGTAATSVNVSSSTSLTCVVPNLGSTGARNVSVTTPGGTATWAFLWTFWASPTITGVSTGRGDNGALTGSTITLTGTNFSSGSISVSVGGVSVTPTVTGTTSLAFTCPNLSTDGSKTISVTTYGGTVTSSVQFWSSKSAATTTYTSGSGNYAIPAWCNKVDVVCCGGGQGGGPGTVGITGRGGQKGSWAAATITRGSNVAWTTTTLSYGVGSGGARGAAGTFPSPGSNGGSSTVTGTVSASGGSGDTGLFMGNGSGNYTFNGVTYTGSVNTEAGGQPGGVPGGGGAGGLIFNGNGGTGGNGTVIFRAYQ